MHGKPRVPGSGLGLPISHSRGRLAVARARGLELDIDIDIDIDKLPDSQTLPRSSLTSSPIPRQRMDAIDGTVYRKRYSRTTGSRGC